MKKLLLATAALALTAGIAAADTIRMGTEGAYAPYNFINDKGELDGFEIELGNELCKRIEAECTWVRNEWDSIIPNLVSSNYDTIMAGMNINEERKQAIAFSIPYTPPPASGYVGLTADAPIDGVVAAQTGTVQSSHVAASGADLLEFGTFDEAVAAVRNGEAEAVLADREFAAPLVTASNGELSWITGQDNLVLAEGLGIGMRKSDTELKARFDKALTDMKADGSLDALITKWLGDKAETFASFEASKAGATAGATTGTTMGATTGTAPATVPPTGAAATAPAPATGAPASAAPAAPAAPATN